MTEGMRALTYAVRLRVVGHYLSQLALMLALLALAPLAVSLLFGEYAFAWRYALVVGLLLLAAVPGLRLPAPERLQTNEAIVIIGLAFLLTPLIMAFPLTVTGLRFEDALFEAVSAVTTTGLSVSGGVEGRSPVFLFARAWMQWYGGFGIAVLSVALLMGHHAAARRLAEPTDSENIATTARTQARQVLRAYLVLTLGGTLILWAILGDGFGALLHMLSTLSTGGFSPNDASLAALPTAAAWVLTAFSFLGAIPLLLYFYAAAGRPGELLRDPEARALVVAVLLVSGPLALSLHHHAGMAWSAAVQHGTMLGVSAQSTTGFSSLPIGELDPTSKLLLIAAMLFGGGSGSTAGGMKLLRLLIVLRLLQHFLQRSAMPPHAVSEPRLAGRPLESPEIERATLVIVLFATVVGLSWLVFVAYGYDPLDALLEVVSAVGTVGLSTGIAAPHLETPLKLLLCLNMWLGRLEILALLVILYPGTWFGKRT